MLEYVLRDCFSYEQIVGNMFGCRKSSWEIIIIILLGGEVGFSYKVGSR